MNNGKYSGSWQRRAKAYKARHPICEACHKRPTIDVHHIEPIARVPEENLAGLCRTCHNRITTGIANLTPPSTVARRYSHLPDLVQIYRRTYELHPTN